jgi:hypothetical protein
MVQCSRLRISYALHSQMRLKSRMISLYLQGLFELGYRGLGLSMVKQNHQKKAKIARAVSLSLLVMIVAAALLNSGPIRLGFAECQGGFTYLVEADSGGYYGLVGLPPNLSSQYANHTTRISVNGTYYPVNFTSYPAQSYRGLIYVTQYVINGVTFSYARTVVAVSGTVTLVSTNTNQISPTTMTIGTSVAKLTPITVTGWLDYVPYCIAAQQTTTTSASANGNSVSVPGFTGLTIILGLIMGISILVVRKCRKQESGRHLISGNALLYRACRRHLSVLSRCASSEV